jgi:tRNA modification GTPase
MTAEADAALAAATTERAALVLLDQRQGALRSAVRLAIDAIASQQIDEAAALLATLLARWPLGRRLVEPWRIVLAGPPNVGKSSLINRLLGYERAIVFDRPGTTRDVVTATTALDGWPCELSDTAGLRDAGDAIERAGVELAKAQIARADLVVLVADASQCIDAADTAAWFRVVAPVFVAPSFDGPVIRAENKCDLRPTTQRHDDPIGPTPGYMSTSAVTGEGIAELATAIIARLVERPPRRGEAVPFTTRQAVLLESAAAALAENQADDAAEAMRACLEP